MILWWIPPSGFVFWRIVLHGQPSWMRCYPGMPSSDTSLFTANCLSEILRRRRRELSKFYSALPSARVIRHADMIQFVQTRKLNGRGIGWIDAHLLASALAENLRVWTADLRLAKAADALGISYGSTGLNGHLASI